MNLLDEVRSVSDANISDFIVETANTTLPLDLSRLNALRLNQSDLLSE